MYLGAEVAAWFTVCSHISNRQTASVISRAVRVERVLWINARSSRLAPFCKSNYCTTRARHGRCRVDGWRKSI